MTEETAKTPEWMLLLENKKKWQHRLAHEIGAGAPCLSCGDSCPGLDLHFWRKLCRNCKCKKEEHDVKDDEGYEQFEILFANSGVSKKKRTGALLNIRVPEVSISTSSSTSSISSNSAAAPAANKKGVAFDWVPPDVPEEVAAEYMQQLPPSKLPISGSDGALYRRQQLESQIPLHDLDANRCHGLTADEIKGLQQYLENLKNNVVGQGRVTKLPVLYSEQRLKYSGPARHQSVTIAHASLTGESRPIRISTSQSAQCLKSLPSLPLPRPYAAQHYDKDESNSFPPPPPDMLPSSATNLGLKTPSAFLPPVQYNAQVVGSHQTHDLLHSSELPLNQGQTSTLGEIARDKLKPDVQTSSQVPGKYYGRQDAPVGESGNKFNVPGEMKPLTYASDGTFVSEQQAHDVAFSSQMPVGMMSQSKALNALKDDSNLIPGEDDVPSNPYTKESAISESQHPMLKDGKLNATQNPEQGVSRGADDGTVLTSQHPSNVVYSSSVPGQKSSAHSIPSFGSLLNNGKSSSDPTGAVSSQDAKFVPYLTNVSGQIVHSAPIAGDSMPKSAHILHQSHLVQQEGWELDGVENELAGKLEQLIGLGDGSLLQEEYHLNCHKCNDVLVSGQVAVLAERAGKQAAWHPQCFVCCTCEELLVDLIYFYHKGDVYCGRHYAELLNIPRCFACDELIFVKEYTCAEGKAFHVKHFCCYECDVPLGGKQYIPKDNQPVCLQCFESKYGKSCHTCKKKIAAGDQRVGWNDLSWHVSPSCFCCSQCLKSLLGGKFLVKNEQPFCSKQCYQAGISF